MQGQDCDGWDPALSWKSIFKVGRIVKKLLVVLILIGLGLVGGAFWLNTAGRTGAEGQFVTVPVEWGAIADTINATGVLQPREITLVGSVLSGEVVEIY